MLVDLRILSGSRSGQSERFGKSVIAIGRHPLSDLRFDPQRDLDVSARHAEIRVVGAECTVRDLGSTNGTFVNGTRIAVPTALHAGDVISFGELGPRVQVALEDDAAPHETAPTPLPAGASAPAGMAASAAGGQPRKPDTSERIAVAVGRETRALRRVVAGLALAVAAVVAAAFWESRGASRSRDDTLHALGRQNDSLTQEYGRRMAALSGAVAGLDSALASAKSETDSLRRALAGASRPAHADSLERALRALESRRTGMLAAVRTDYSGIVARNGAAVVLIAVQWPDGSAFSGTGFCLASNGTIITNRHLVHREGVATPSRIAVIFSDTRSWLPARVERVSRDADLAELRMDVDGPFPTVQGLAPPSASIAVGGPVAIIGYPLGTDTPMEGSGTHITARSSLSAGTVSKTLSTVLQVDAYAGEGSSGSPVFDGAGRVIGVVYGAARESNGRIVYAVPRDAVTRLLGG